MRDVWLRVTLTVDGGRVKLDVRVVKALEGSAADRSDAMIG